MTISITDKEISGKPQDGEVVLSVKGTSKKFCRDLKRSLLYGVQDIATEVVGIRGKSEKLRPKEFYVAPDRDGKLLTSIMGASTVQIEPILFDPMML